MPFSPRASRYLPEFASMNTTSVPLMFTPLASVPSAISVAPRGYLSSIAEKVTAHAVRSTYVGSIVPSLSSVPLSVSVNETRLTLLGSVLPTTPENPSQADEAANEYDTEAISEHGIILTPRASLPLSTASLILVACASCLAILYTALVSKH